jgi:hypothetical protein
VRPVKRTQTLVPTAVMRAMIVVSIQKQRRKDPLNAFHATTVRCRKKVVLNVNFVKQECSVRVLVKPVKIAMLDNTVKVKKTTMKLQQMPPFVLIVQRGIHQVLVVPSAKRVEQVPMVMDVNPVLKAITVTVLIQLLHHVENAQLAKSCPSKVQPNALIAFLENFKIKKAM